MTIALSKDRERRLVERAIWNAFGMELDITMPEIARDVYTGPDNPGGWAPGADWVVYTERYIPNPGEHPELAPAWQGITDRLCGLLDAKVVWHEPVNASVVAIYIE